jgi:hypothetical protein
VESGHKIFNYYKMIPVVYFLRPANEHVFDKNDKVRIIGKAWQV